MRTRAVLITSGIFLVLQGCSSNLGGFTPTSQIPLTTDTTPANTPTPGSHPNGMPSESLTPTPDLSRFEMHRTSTSSPGGSWAAEITVALPPAGSISLPHSYYTNLVVTSTKEGYSLAVIEGWSEIGLGAPTPIIVGWSPDEEFMYFADQAIPDGCARFAYLSHLRRLNLDTGRIIDLPAALERRISLSPDAVYIASINRAEHQLLLYSVQDDGMASFLFDPKTEEWAAAEFSWSPDGSIAVLPILHGPSCEEESTSLIGIDVTDLAPLIFLEEYPVVVPFVEWVDNSAVRLTDGQEETVLLDVNQGDVLEQ